MTVTELRGPAIEPREIMQQGDAGLRITWADERVCHYAAAGCVALVLRAMRE